MDRLREARQNARRNHAHMATQTTGMTKNVQNGVQLCVDLTKQTCGCPGFPPTGFPSEHAVMCILGLGG